MPLILFHIVIDLMEKRSKYNDELKVMAQKLYHADLLTRATDPIYGWWSLFWIRGYSCLMCKGTRLLQF